MAGERGTVRPDRQHRPVGPEREPVWGCRRGRFEIRPGADQPDAPDTAADAAQAAQYRAPVAVFRRSVGLRPQHRVGQFDNAVGPFPSGHQHRGIGHVFLFAEHRGGRPEAEIPAAFGVEQGTEHRPAVVIGQTPPADRAVGRHRRGGAPVADHPQALDRRIWNERRPILFHGVAIGSINARRIKRRRPWPPLAIAGCTVVTMPGVHAARRRPPDCAPALG